MKSVSIVIALLSCVSMTVAQQPNTPGFAALRVNGADGPSWPITGPTGTGVQMPRGFSQNVVVEGQPIAPFLLFGSGSLLGAGYPALGGLLDVNITGGWVELFNGLNDPNARTNASGTFTTSVPLPSSATVGTSAAFQCIVTDPTNAPWGARFTAASLVQVAQGLTVVTLTFSGAEPGLAGAAFNLSSYGLAFPFYNNSYSSMFVNSDGAITFNANTTDFTPTPTEFLSGTPRIAPFWTDLNPTIAGGNVTVTVDESGFSPFPTVKVNWNRMAEWSNSGSLHWFDCTLTCYPAGGPAPGIIAGDIEMHHPTNNPAMIYDILMGITPGGIISGNHVNHPQFNFSSTLPPPAGTGAMAMGTSGLAFWEWYGVTGGSMPYYTATQSNPWDMTGTTTYLQNIGAGALGASYNVWSTAP